MNGLRILAVDSSAKSASVSILEDNKNLAEIFINTNFTHSQTLMPMTQSLFDFVKLTPDDIDVFAVAAGPGSFTGLRIGISAIKGMAFSLNKPCVAVSTLQSLAYNVTTSAVICPVMDARCSQVYTAMFEYNGEKHTRLCDDEAILISDLKEKIQNITKNVILVGDGAQMCYNVLKDSCQNVVLASENVRFQRAFSVAQVANEEYIKGNFVKSDELNPLYLRLPQAERELLKKKEKEKML
jgi:tRNA threonylcarbamoyladenosine biosynthesis protein TsaB